MTSDETVATRVPVAASETTLNTINLATKFTIHNQTFFFNLSSPLSPFTEANTPGDGTLGSATKAKRALC